MGKLGTLTPNTGNLPLDIVKKIRQLDVPKCAAGVPSFYFSETPVSTLKGQFDWQPHKASFNTIGNKYLGLETTLQLGVRVTMLKHLGLSSEEVCEVGKWKNVAAFTSHYLRLGASTKVGQKVQEMVHSVSPLESAEPDLTWTTGKTDPGGNVREGGARDNGETRFCSPAMCNVIV